MHHITACLDCRGYAILHLAKTREVIRYRIKACRSLAATGGRNEKC